MATFSDRKDTVRGMARAAVSGAYARMGSEAVAQLRLQMSGPQRALAPVAVPGTWFPGDSVGRCPAP
jgi:hypothetical protein